LFHLANAGSDGERGRISAGAAADGRHLQSGLGRSQWPRLFQRRSYRGKVRPAQHFLAADCAALPSTWIFILAPWANPTASRGVSPARTFLEGAEASSVEPTSDRTAEAVSAAGLAGKSICVRGDQYACGR